MTLSPLDNTGDTPAQKAVIMLLTGGILFMIMRLNPNYDPDRHYYKHNKLAYHVMKLCYLVVVFAFVINIKFLLLDGLQAVFVTILSHAKKHSKSVKL